MREMPVQEVEKKLRRGYYEHKCDYSNEKICRNSCESKSEGRVEVKLSLLRNTK